MFTASIKDFKTYSSSLGLLSYDGLRHEKRGTLARKAIENIVGFSSDYDALTTVSQSALGAQLLSAARGILVSDEEIKRVLYFLARFIREKTVKSGLTNGIEQEILDFYGFQNFKELDPEELIFADFIAYGVPQHVFKETAEEAKASILPQVEKVEVASATATQALADLERHSKAVATWEGSLEGWATKVEGYEKRLRQFEQAYNFVGLAQGFKAFLDEKRVDKWFSIAALIFFGVVMVVPLMMQFSTWPESLSFFKQSWDVTSWPRFLPLLALEVILLYFFRIALKNYYTVKNEILQLRLRWSLCAFVESYVDFASEKKGDNIGERLARFESVIFSSLNSEIGDVPRTLDMLESIATIAKEFKGK